MSKNENVVNHTEEILMLVSVLLKNTKSIAYKHGMKPSELPLDVHIELELNARILDVYCKLLLRTTSVNKVSKVYKEMNTHNQNSPHPLLGYLFDNRASGSGYKFGQVINAMDKRRKKL